MSEVDLLESEPWLVHRPQDSRTNGDGKPANRVYATGCDDVDPLDVVGVSRERLDASLRRAPGNRQGGGDAIRRGCRDQATDLAQARGGGRVEVDQRQFVTAKLAVECPRELARGRVCGDHGTQPVTRGLAIETDPRPAGNLDELVDNRFRPPRGGVPLEVGGSGDGLRG